VKSDAWKGREDHSQQMLDANQARHINSTFATTQDRKITCHATYGTIRGLGSEPDYGLGVARAGTVCLSGKEEQRRVCRYTTE
jgi:hypothetical protein